MKSINILLLSILLSIKLFASVRLKSQDFFIKGETFIFKYEVSGSSVKFPKIDKIDNYVVQNLGTSSSIEVINGNRREKISKTYEIVPQNDFIIPSFTFNIDGKNIKSEVKKVVAKKISKTISNNFNLSLKASKNDLYVGEDLLITLVFKYKKGLQISDLRFAQSHFENFWSKKIKNPSKMHEENGYIVQELKFLLFPQKSGKLTIDPLRVIVGLVNSQNSMGTFNFFSPTVKTKNIYSNPLSFNVKNLPQNVSLIGKFNISSTIDKNSINQGDSISYELKIEGFGNFDDIGELKLKVLDALVYDNKAVIKTKYTPNGYEGVYTKIFSIVPNNSTTIPKLSITYFDKVNKQIVTKETNSFRIEVKNAIKKQTVLQKKVLESKPKTIIKHSVKNLTLEQKGIYFFLGIIITLLIITLFYVFKINKTSKTKKRDTPLVKQVKRVKSKQELIKLLAPLVKKDDKLDRLIFKCEGKKDLKDLKKEIIILLKDLKLER